MVNFKNILQSCKYLERMDLEECNQITDLTLSHLATGCPSLEKLVSFFQSKFTGIIISEINSIK